MHCLLEKIQNCAVERSRFGNVSAPGRQGYEIRSERGCCENTIHKLSIATSPVKPRSCLEILVSVAREYRRLTSAPGGGCVRAPGGNSGKRSPGGLCRQSHFRLRYARPRPSFLSER